MPKGNCLIVRAAGKRLDLLRGEAARIAQGANAGWWTDRAEIGTRFCFEDSKTKDLFALTCDGLGISCEDG
ncbi:hypothetical protein BwSH20_47450 [Bradyrhizobium ottawaense]|nr:hypothetical protein TM233_21050 [Bradyrhizobium sp. TM233]GMO63635.1 hypothetical protein BwSG10_13850 [Bradyrhizobium ottawaense]GMO94772.1 hypothetical protein BwDG23_13850 [Bradyrhizobium ottawaense]GMP05950.1 hypothetical protein BwSH20_47450 [Bradyrhizobium ottawaense]GMP16563.1 hypothetical protein BwSH12_25650 [Bradyrhizobium ottawaense]